MHTLLYADNAATTRVDDAVIAAMIPHFRDHYGNASSLYPLGQEAKAAITDARIPIAALIGAKPEEIIFTGSGTEADNMALKGILHSPVMKKQGKNHLITTTVEHPAILQSAAALEKEGFAVTYLPVDRHGLPNLAELEAAITPQTALISIMAANNEIGTIVPLVEIGQIAKKHGVLFHSDGVQALGHTPIQVDDMNLSLLSLSAHKIHGPKGVGVLYQRKGVYLDPVITGGGQEKNRRSGTENVPGIVGFGVAAQLMLDNMDKDNAHTKALTDRLTQGLLAIPKSQLTGHPTQRLPGTASFAFEAIEGEGMLLLLAMQGICASTGSACSTGSLDPSHVLMAIGLTHEVAHGSLRLSLSKYNTMDEVEFMIEKITQVVEKLRAMSPVWNN